MSKSTKKPLRVEAEAGSASHNPESASGTADAGAASSAAPAEASTPPAPVYVACWPLRHERQNYDADAELPAFAESETQSLLRVGAIRAR
ncbi:MAG: hypothetical protein ACT4QA_17580 [Panacagrimonas sp.]